MGPGVVLLAAAGREREREREREDECGEAAMGLRAMGEQVRLTTWPPAAPLPFGCGRQARRGCRRAGEHESGFCF